MNNVRILNNKLQFEFGWSGEKIEDSSNITFTQILYLQRWCRSQGKIEICFHWPRQHYEKLTELILINQLKLTGLQKNRDAAANFGISWNRVNGNYGN